MSIKLKETETIKIVAHLHWSSLIFPSFWAGCFTISILSQLIGSNKDEFPFLLSIIIGYFPLAYRYFQNKCKHYVITNERLFVEEGILAKKKKDIPLQKINDMEVNQSFFQRIFGAGNIFVLTGNDQPTVLKNIDKPDDFKNTLSDEVSAISKKVV